MGRSTYENIAHVLIYVNTYKKADPWVGFDRSKAIGDLRESDQL